MDWHAKLALQEIKKVLEHLGENTREEFIRALFGIINKHRTIRRHSCRDAKGRFTAEAPKFEPWQDGPYADDDTTPADIFLVIAEDLGKYSVGQKYVTIGGTVDSTNFVHAWPLKSMSSFACTKISKLRGGWDALLKLRRKDV